MTKDELLAQLRSKDCEMTLQDKLRLTVLLSMPAIIAQCSFIAMQMIDAAMLGHLSTNQAAAVGLVSTWIWCFGSVTSAFAQGFSVQVAHRIGASDTVGARSVIRQGMLSGFLFAVCMSLLGLCLAPYIPYWMGAPTAIYADATKYFSIFCTGIPLVVLNSISAGSLRCSGNIKVPSILMVGMCAMDVFFNYIFIYKLNCGAAGAAYGTIVSYLITMVCMTYTTTIKDPVLRFSNDKPANNTLTTSNDNPVKSNQPDGIIHYSLFTIHYSLTPFLPQKKILTKAFRIGFPMATQGCVMNFAQVFINSIIAPLGSVAIVSNSFGINIESMCYMPGYGIAEAATTLVGQSKGAEKRNYMHEFAWICMALGMSIMAFMGLIMWIFAPEMYSWLTPDQNVIELGTQILRIEAWAEPGFAAAIIAMSVFVGAGKTLVPSIMNLGSIWAVRVSLTLLLAPEYGLRGVWIAMAIELIFRGTIFIIRLCTKGWSYIKPMELRNLGNKKPSETP